MGYILGRKILLLAAFILCVGNAGAQNWDVHTAATINGWHVHGLSRTLSTSGSVLSAGIPVVMGVYALVQKDKPLLRDAVYIGTSVIEAAGITYGLKEICDRRRPFAKYPDRIHPYHAPSWDSPSFPSVHTAAAFSLATSLSITYPKWYVIAPSALWAVGVGLSRINQGAHYPTDVLGGAAVGVGCAFLNVYVNRWLNKWLFK